MIEKYVQGKRKNFFLENYNSKNTFRPFGLLFLGVFVKKKKKKKKLNYIYSLFLKNKCKNNFKKNKKRLVITRNLYPKKITHLQHQNTKHH